jgi:hypothetical protein
MRRADRLVAHCCVGRHLKGIGDSSCRCCRQLERRIRLDDRKLAPALSSSQLTDRSQVNCFFSAGYVLAMRKRIKITNFSDWDSMMYNNLLSVPVLVFFSLVLEDWSAENLARNL